MPCPPYYCSCPYNSKFMFLIIHNKCSLKGISIFLKPKNFVFPTHSFVNVLSKLWGSTSSFPTLPNGIYLLYITKKFFKHEAKKIFSSLWVLFPLFYRLIVISICDFNLITSGKKFFYPNCYLIIRWYRFERTSLIVSFFVKIHVVIT